ncbi:MAG: M48 family metallopeptidase, partial [Acidobacteriaceae bacterium]
SIEAALTFKERVHAWASKVRVKPKQVRLQAMKRKWASCSTEGRVTFSLDLLEEASSFQDYVIVHELIHLKVPNHGKLFRSLLSAHLPGYKHAAKPEAKLRGL